MQSSVTLKEKAYHELRKRILNGDLKPGEFLTEKYLVETLKMSRTPIRAALERLVVEGLVKHSPNQGLIVAELSLKRAIDIYDIRVALESHVVRKLAARDWTDREKKWFEENLQKQKQAVETRNYEEFTLEDSLFHKQLTRMYENDEIIKIMDNIQDQLYLIAMKVLRKEATRIIQSYEDHYKIFECIINGKGEEAAEEVTKHLEFGKQILIS